MSELILAMDIDGTLIPSRKAHRDGDICVECINGEESGFLLQEMLQALKRLAGKARLIPITTRSIEQYLRIDWPDAIRPEESYPANGSVALRLGSDGILSCDNIVSLESYESELNDLVQSLSRDARFRNSRIVDGSYVMAIIRQEWLEDDFSNIVFNETKIRKYREGRKLYLFPLECNKGKAVEHIRSEYRDCEIFCAGDSKNDWTMAAYSDEFLFVDEADMNKLGCFEKAVIDKLEWLADKHFAETIGQNNEPPFQETTMHFANRKNVMSSGIMKVIKSS